MGETDLSYELIEQAGILRDDINNKELETLYYKFDLPEDLDYPKTVNLSIKIKSSADFSSSPNVYGFLLFDNYLRYLNTGSFATANSISSGNDYTFDTIRLDVDQNIPTETNIEYYADYNDNTRRVLSSGVDIPLLSEISQIKIDGELTTNNNTVSPIISNISLTAIGETPLSNDLESVSDLDTSTSGTLSISTDRVVGSHSIMIDHSSQGYGEYTIRSEQNFNTDKLPVVKLWVKPLTDNDISFKIHDVTAGIDETITSDSDHNGYFEIGEDLRKDEWNLLLLDLKETAGGGVEKDAGTLKVVINSYGTKVLLDGVDSLPLNEASYEYDKAGNRSYHTVNGLVTTYEYKPGTNLLERRYNSREEIWYQYDYEGNLISQRITDNLIGDITIFDYCYNELNQLEEVRKNSQLIAEYSYDHGGLRYRKVDYLSGKTTIYIYGQGTEPIYEEIYDNEDITIPIEQNSYLFMGSKRIAKDSDGVISYYYTDHLGSTRAVDISGKITRLDYAPFGEDFRPTSERYKFTGKEDDISTGLHYYNARYYDPAIGRFITEDPAKDGGNWYVYCGNSSLRYVDPDGLNPLMVVYELLVTEGPKLIDTIYNFYLANAPTINNYISTYGETALDTIGYAKNPFNKRGYNSKFKKLSSQSADEINYSLKALGYTEAPYKPGTVVDTIELTEQTQFVRVYDGVNSQQAGGWVMKAKDIAGLTPKQIQNKFALPSMPKYVTDVVFESGTKLRTGTANGLFGFDGGGNQFDLMGQYIGDFENPRLLQ